MKIKEILCSAGRTGFFFDDQKAIKGGAKADGNSYEGEPHTTGFKNIRQPGESISVLCILEDGQVAFGDCAAVQYSGAGGRDPLFLAEDFIPLIEREIRPLFTGEEVTSFREMAALADSHIDSQTQRPLHTAVRYGVTQALLDCAAKAQRKLMAQVIAEEYGQTLSDSLIPIFSQSGDERYDNCDKMILKGSQVMPHGLINNLEKLGERGETLHGYIRWLRDRVLKLRTSENYLPTLHIDVYGTMGLAFDLNMEKIAQTLGQYAEAAAPFPLRIEGPIDMGEREGQIEALAELRRLVDNAGYPVEIVADEWCNTLEDIKAFTDCKAGHMAQIKTPDLGGINNTIEAVIYCKEKGMGAYLGGTCNETDRSAQVGAHIAMATQPLQYLAKPGMGVDEGFMIVYNEMQRILALSKAL